MDDTAQSDGIARWELAVNRIAELEAENERLHETISAYEDKCLDMEYAKLKVMEELSELREYIRTRFDGIINGAGIMIPRILVKIAVDDLLSADKGDG